MPQINLLPWRQEQRKEQQRQFLTIMIMSLALMVLIILATHLQINRMISTQESRNNLLTQVIKDVNTQLSEIKNLESEKQRLLDRMKIIQQLQRDRPEVVRLFDDLARTVPNGIYLKLIKQQTKGLSIEGLAQSNARVSSFMRNLESSKSMTNPSLSVIKSGNSKNVNERNFKLHVVHITEDEASKDTNKPKKR
ncbi:Type IV pilus biogenesis protein PilN [hydrothermal vent metagenome]|uniref:Type IV pilus biogenesis protein PilN n=1 Tax=hydrothermal vent metagenome TaxID=652676 RepID=A0A3B0ZN93_9ZZZZ